MGMFDDVRVEAPLPVAGFDGARFQTKDLNCELRVYTITAEGRLTVRQPEWDCYQDLFSGEIEFYAFERGSPEGHPVAPTPLHFFRATFERGRLVKPIEYLGRLPGSGGP